MATTQTLAEGLVGMVAGEAVQAGRRRHWHGRPPDRLGRRRQRRRCRRLGPAGSAGTGPTRPQRRLGRCVCCFGRADRLVPAGAGGNGADRVAGLGSVLLWFAVFVPRRRRRACGGRRVSRRRAEGRDPPPRWGWLGWCRWRRRRWRCGVDRADPAAAAGIGWIGGGGADAGGRREVCSGSFCGGGDEIGALPCSSTVPATVGASAPPWARASRLSTECLWECFVVWDRC